MFKAFAYIQLGVWYAPHKRTPHSSHHDIETDHVGLMLRRTLQHTNNTHTCMRARRQWACARVCSCVNSRELFIHLFTTRHRLDGPMKLSVWTQQYQCAPINVCVGLKNWVRERNLLACAHTKWANVGSGGDDSDDGKKSNHSTADVNHELTMTSQIKWPPIRSNAMRVCECMGECGVDDVLEEQFLPFIRSNKRDDSHTNADRVYGVYVVCCFMTARQHHITVR